MSVKLVSLCNRMSSREITYKCIQGVYRVAIAIGSKKTGKNYTAEWLGFSQLYDCTFPHIEVQNRSSPVWCNQAAACISQGIAIHQYM